jgi:hypothetical protein
LDNLLLHGRHVENRHAWYRHLLRLQHLLLILLVHPRI